MSKSTIVLLGILGTFVFGIVILIGMYVSASNSANRYEQTIAASYQESQNVLGQLAPKLKEALGVTKLEASAVRDIVTGANTSRYGANGSQATVQFIKEQNPALNPAGYNQVRTMIEAARNDFTEAQRRTIDQNRAYKTALNNIPGSFFMRMAGYPTAEYTSKHYDDVVMSGHAADAFTTRRDNGVDLNAM